jgi:phenylacetate-CoA ligase
MVKLRGINVWPEALGELAMAVPGVTGDYFVQAVRRDGRDDMVLSVVGEGDPAGFATLSAAVGKRLTDILGLAITVNVVRPGELDALTQIETVPKPKRFADERGL